MDRTTPPLLSVEDLVTEFRTADGVVHAVDRVSYQLWPGETLVTEGWNVAPGKIALQVKVKERDETVCSASWALTG